MYTVTASFDTVFVTAREKVEATTCYVSLTDPPGFVDQVKVPAETKTTGIKIQIRNIFISITINLSPSNGG